MSKTTWNCVKCGREQVLADNDVVANPSLLLNPCEKCFIEEYEDGNDDQCESDDEPETVSELLEEFIDEKRLRFEGERGVESLNVVAKALGYKETGFRYGSSLEEFLQDNSGAMEAILDWIRQQDLPEWRDSIESCLEEKD